MVTAVALRRPTRGSSRAFRSRAVRRRWLRRLWLVVVVGLLLPVPWLYVMSDQPLGMAWRLDGRLRIEGEVIDPDGEWSWLTVGRPPLVAEVLRDALADDGDSPLDMTKAPPSSRPALAEPSAVVVGMLRAGSDLTMGLLVQAWEPMLPGYPEQAVIVKVDGIELSDRAAWDRARARVPDSAGDAGSTSVADTGSVDGTRSVDLATTAEPHEIRFTTADGMTFTAPGPWLPYGRVDVLDLAPADLDAGVVFFDWLAETALVDWTRDLSLGSSHGMMVALMTYAHMADPDLAQGRHIAGTGGIRGDGVVTRIGGLFAKATAARRAGADVLLYPAEQTDDLAGFDRGAMTLVPVATLSDAIAWLEQPLL